MTKSDIIKTLMEKFGLSQVAAKKVVQRTFESFFEAADLLAQLAAARDARATKTKGAEPPKVAPGKPGERGKGRGPRILKKRVPLREALAIAHADQACSAVAQLDLQKEPPEILDQVRERVGRLQELLQRGQEAPAQPGTGELDPRDDAQMEQWRTVTLDRAQNRIQAESKRMRALGIIDGDGNLLRRDVPPDMEPDSKTGV